MDARFSAVIKVQWQEGRKKHRENQGENDQSEDDEPYHECPYERPQFMGLEWQSSESTEVPDARCTKEPSLIQTEKQCDDHTGPSAIRQGDADA
jgi:hypothetical protein